MVSFFKSSVQSSALRLNENYGLVAERFIRYFPTP
jgi:hypothetical protein